jgi:hypothetical protein
MAKTRPVIPVGWFLREWMDSLHVDQATMMREAGWSKTTASLLYNCQQDYNPNLVKAASHALKIREFELLLPPGEAFHIRRLRQAVEEEHQLRAVSEKQIPFIPATDSPPAPPPRKTPTRRRA